MATAAWYLDHKLVAALRVGDRAKIIEATDGLASMLGTTAESLLTIDMSYFCEHYLGGSVSVADLLQISPDDDAGIASQIIDQDGRLRQIRVHGGPFDGDARTLLFTDTTAAASAQDYLVRRMAHDRLLHVLVSDLLDDATREPDLVVADVLTGFADYFEFITAALTVAGTSSPTVLSYVSSVETSRQTFDRLSTELQLIEAPDVDELLDIGGPGDVWHVPLDAEDSYALGIKYRALTCVQVTVPFFDEEELSFIATIGGRIYPRKADLELVHKALSHIAQYLRRSQAEERIRRHSALEEALATARAQLMSADRPPLEALSFSVERVAAITKSTRIELRPLARVDPQLARAFEGWTAARPVSPESLGHDAGVHGTWAVPVSDAHGPIALLSYAVEDARTENDAANAWNRLVELVPGATPRADVERRLEAAFHNAPVGIALRDFEGKLIDCNEAFVRFVGAVDADALIGSDRVSLIDLDACPQHAIELLRRESAFERLELPFAQRGARPAWGRVTTTVVEDGPSSVLLDHVEDVTVTRATEAALASERRQDALTGLPNRSEIESKLGKRMANGEPITVTAVDLDHFASVNASLGHIAGDRLLQLVAERLQLTVGPRAELARIGGDEFVVISATASQQLSRDLADRILASLRQPFEVDGNELLTGASVGVCINRGATTPSELLLSATDALNEAKHSGRNRVVHFQSQGQRRRIGLFESELRRAVHERSLDVYYQPEFDVDTRLIVGAEALVRWQHPTEGLLGAGAFVPLIEEIGLSTELCDYVLEEACNAAVEWRETLAPNPFKIRINLSPRDIEQPNIVDRVMQTISDAGLPVQAVCLEITETAVMRDQRRVVQHLHQFSDLGVSLAIDDFGTGFSSLWLLRELPFDTLKIDQAFIKVLDSGNPTDRAIVETIVSLGHTLGMEVTAEGVETESQFAALQSIGIKRAQGFLLARPAPRSELVGTARATS